MSDAEQDLGSDYGDEEEEDEHNQNHHNHREWSPKQYSVSSNEEEEEDEHMDAEDAILISPCGLRRDEEVSSDECEETKYERHYKDADLSVFREIVNEERNDNYISESEDEENHP